jgi:hypothetical protein
MMLLVLAAAAVFLAPIPGVELPAAWRQALVPSGESRQRPPAGSGPVKMKVSGAKTDTPTPAPAAGRPSGVVPAADRTTAPAAAGSDPPADLAGRAPERAGAAAKRDGGDPPERSGTKDSGMRADTGSAPAEPLAAAGAEDAAAQPPEFLGTVILGERETLWRLVEKVYGVFEKDYLKSVLAANPRIRDPNHVEIGRGIRLPAIPAAVEPPGRKGWWIRLEQKSGLNDAIEALRRHPKEMPPVRILSYWHPAKGMVFSMILQERFTDEAAARYEIERLAAASGVTGELVSGWPPETVFYADPWG